MENSNDFEIPNSLIGAGQSNQSVESKNQSPSSVEISAEDLGINPDDLIGIGALDVNLDEDANSINQKDEIESGSESEDIDDSIEEQSETQLSEYDQLIEFGILNGEFEALTKDQIEYIRNEFNDPKEAFIHIKRQEKEAFADQYIANDFLGALSPEVRLLVEAELSGVNMNEYREIQSAHNYYNSISDDSFSDESFLIGVIANKVYSDMAQAGKSITEDEAYEKATARYNADPDYSEMEARRIINENKSYLERKLESIFPESEKARVKREKAEAQAIQEFPIKVQGFLKESKEIIKGVPIDGTVSEKILAAITHPHAEDEYGNVYNYVQYIQKQNPEKFTARLTYLALAGLFDDNIGADKLISIAQSMKQQSKVSGNSGIAKVLNNITKGPTSSAKKSSGNVKLSDLEDYI
jgi:hypothetical protein